MFRKQCYFLRPNFHLRKTKTQSSEGKFKWWKWKEDVSFSISKPYLYWEIPLFKISILARGVISWIVKFKGKKEMERESRERQNAVYFVSSFRTSPQYGPCFSCAWIFLYIYILINLLNSETRANFHRLLVSFYELNQKNSVPDASHWSQYFFNNVNLGDRLE